MIYAGGLMFTLRLILICTLLICLLSCQKTKTKVRIGINPWPGYEMIYLAKHLGYFDSLGLDVKLVDLTTTLDQRRVFERGLVDVFSSTIVEVLVSRENSARRPEIFHIIDYSDGADVVLAHPKFQSLNQIKGQRVGIELGTVDIYNLYLSLRKVGLSYDDVQIVPMSQPELIDKFKNGELDFATSYPPTSVISQNQGIAHAVHSTQGSGGLIVDVMSIDSAFAAQNPEVIPALREGFNLAVEYMHAHPKEVYELLGNREQIGAEAFAETLNGVKIATRHDQDPYFAGGKLQHILTMANQALRSQKMLNQAPCIQECIYLNP